MADQSRWQSGLEFLNANRQHLKREFSGKALALNSEGVVAVAGNREELLRELSKQGLNNGSLWFYDA